MPDVEEIEQETKDHSKQVDEGIGKFDHEADEWTNGMDHGLIDKGAAEIEIEKEF